VASIYAKKGTDVLWARLKDESGKWIGKPTRYKKGDEKNAKRYADAAQKKIDERRSSGSDQQALTVKVWADRWLATRRETHRATLARYNETGHGTVQYRDHANDESRMAKHVIPHIGSMLIAEVHAKHLVAWIHTLRTTTTLAPHTIRNIYGLASAMLSDAEIAGHIERAPTALKKAQLGEDEGNPDGAGRYSREHFATMIGDELLRENERVFCALGGLAGLRLGEIAGLRWGDLDTTAQPLWRLTSSRAYDAAPTKTSKPRVIPVHPVLADMLASWRHGFGRVFGRAPTASDPIVPKVPGRWIANVGGPHTKQTGGDLMDRILATLEIPSAPMKAHALRSTFISMALEDGADDRLIERITHTPGKKRRAFDRYDRADYWPQLCAEVAKVKIAPRSGGKVIPLATAHATGGSKRAKSRPNMVETPGVERGPMSASVHEKPGFPDVTLSAGNAHGRSRTPTVASLATTVAWAIEVVAGSRGVALPPGFAEDVARAIERELGTGTILPVLATEKTRGV
jgi:integrase